MPANETLVPIGQIVSTHGVKGGLKVLALTDFPSRFAVGEILFLKGQPRKILRSNIHEGQFRIQLEGITTMSMGEELKWEFLSVPSGSVPKMAKNEFMVQDLLGMTVTATTGEVIGTVTNIQSLPAQDVLVLGKIMIPFVKEFVKSIDTATKNITVELIPGLLPEREELEEQ